MDKIADFLTCIRNALILKKKRVSTPHSKITEDMAKVLLEEGFVENFKVIDDPSVGSKKKTLHVYLKYSKNGDSPLHELKRKSTPGRRIYVSNSKIPKIMDGFGISILSTSKGVLSSRKAKMNKIGGELLCTIL